MGESVHLRAGHRRLDQEAGNDRRCGIVGGSARTLAGFISAVVERDEPPIVQLEIESNHDPVAAR